MSNYDKIKKCVDKSIVELRKFDKNQHDFEGMHVKLSMPSKIELNYLKGGGRSEEVSSETSHKV